MDSSFINNKVPQNAICRINLRRARSDTHSVHRAVSAMAETWTFSTSGHSPRWRRRRHSHDGGDVLSLHESIEVERPHELLISIRAENTHPAVVLEGLIKRRLDKGSPKLNKPKIYFSLP
jgi:hypothetical protein